MDNDMGTPIVPSSDRTKSIVSVNDRGGSSGNLAAKVVFIMAVLTIAVVAALFSVNRWRAAHKAADATAAADARNVNKPAQVGPRRDFDTDAATLPPVVGAMKTAASGGAACPDGAPGIVMIASDGKPLMNPAGLPMRVCKDGRVLVPALEGPDVGARPVAPGGAVAVKNGAPVVSIYAGDVVIPGHKSGLAGLGQLGPLGQGGATNPAAIAAVLSALQPKPAATTPSLFAGAPASQVAASNPSAGAAGALGPLLSSSKTTKVSASMMGNRSMIVPKGTSIDCALSFGLVNELPGMATCVLGRNVYSDDGKVLLLERGSVATGEYRSFAAQGQDRVFVLWTRIETRSGVVIDLDSPAADALGTSGLDGVVDNHWGKRLGAAFMLSLVQDVVGIKQAQAQGGTNGGTVIVQNTGQTANTMAERVLDSTINIKPTIYKNQGDRATIFVARDLDFGSVYALRAD